MTVTVLGVDWTINVLEVTPSLTPVMNLVLSDSSLVVVLVGAGLGGDSVPVTGAAEWLPCSERVDTGRLGSTRGREMLTTIGLRALEYLSCDSGALAVSLEDSGPVTVAVIGQVVVDTGIISVVT